MDELTKQVVYNGEVKLDVKGRGYTVKPLPLQYIVSGDFQKSGLLFPRDAKDPGRFQLFNVDSAEKRAQLDEWLKNLLTLNGEAMSLDAVAAHGWDIVDLGRFLDLVVQISG